PKHSEPSADQSAGLRCPSGDFGYITQAADAAGSPTPAAVFHRETAAPTGTSDPKKATPHRSRLQWEPSIASSDRPTARRPTMPGRRTPAPALLPDGRSHRSAFSGHRSAIAPRRLLRSRQTVLANRQAKVAAHETSRSARNRVRVPRPSSRQPFRDAAIPH